uniref:Uncharacterized protein n=1 Tax=Anguilla anguilla TaxID=7936 RepID=A0A0E9XF60_ANGAN
MCLPHIDGTINTARCSICNISHFPAAVKILAVCCPTNGITLMCSYLPQLQLPHLPLDPPCLQLPQPFPLKF